MLKYVTIVLFLVTANLLAACGDEAPGGGDSIRAFTEGMRWQSGFVPFYADDSSGRLYLLLDPGNAELLYVPSLPRGLGSNDVGLDRGQIASGSAYLVRFEPAGDRVLLQRLNTRYRAESLNAPERRSAEEAFASSVLWGFPVVARDGEQRLVDATEFLLRDSHGVARRLKAQEQGSFSLDASRSALYFPRSRAFPRNTELEAVVSFTGDDPGEFVRQVAPDPHAITVHMHHSFIALPDLGYSPRAYHPESGFMAHEFADYAVPITEPLEQRYLRRHRLQKRDKYAQRSEPVQPIVYYLDPGVPEPVRSALLEGSSWWDEAFDAAGFVDAFRVEMLPEHADPMDVRYNVIQWVHRATRGWSYGSSVVDPRTGEIIKGHVTLGSLRVRQDLLIARGMTSPFSDDVEADALSSEMALARIRQLAAHEVGHTLGIAHNFAASARARASVMDYPYPLMALNDAGDVVLEDSYAVGIGDWDKRVILYGYGSFGEGNAERDALRAVLAENRELGFAFITDADSREIGDFHPRSHLWDNGAEPVAELDRLLKLRAVALKKFGLHSVPPGTPLGELQEALVPVYFFHRYQIEAVGKLLGGADYRYPLRGELADGEEALTYVSPAQQEQALAALLKALEPGNLTVPVDLLRTIPPKAASYERTRESPPSKTGALFDPLTLAESAAGHVLHVLLHRERLARVALQHSTDDSQLSLDGLFRRLHGEVLQPEYPGYEGAVDRRRAAVLLSQWRGLLLDPEAAPEVRAAARAALLRAQQLFGARRRGDADYRDFYALEMEYIRQVLQPSQPPPAAPVSSPPPGAPIGSPP